MTLRVFLSSRRLTKESVMNRKSVVVAAAVVALSGALVGCA